MKIIIAKTAGFCFGVQRAVSLCEEAAGKHKGCVTLGPIIHNRHVIEHLQKMGVRAISDIYEAEEGSTVIIRSHGAAKAEYDILSSIGASIIDATCPDVRRIHRIVEEESNNARLAVIIGERRHPEIIAISGWCNDFVVFETTNELQKWLLEGENARKPLSFVFQTTSNMNNYASFVEIIKKECTNSKVFDTICNATNRRQKEAAELSKVADAVVVIGDKGSANSLRLADICKEHNQRVFFIESADELASADLRLTDTIAVTAGASTPAWIIKEVTQKMMSDDVRQDETNLDTESHSDAVLSDASEPKDGLESTGAVNTEGITEDAADAAEEQVAEQIDAQVETQLEASVDSEDASDAQESVPQEPLEPEQEALPVFVDPQLDATGQERGLLDEAPPEAIDSSYGMGEPEPSIDESYDSIAADTDDDSAASSESFAEMLEKSIQKPLHTGQRVTGIVTSITSTEVSVDLGTKQSGYIPISEFADDQNSDIDDLVKVGDTIESFVVRINDVEGMVMLSKKRLDAIRNWNEIEAAKDDKTVVEGLVTEENKGGIVVNIKGVRVFVPASQTGLPKSSPMTELVRTNVRLMITEVNQSRRRVVGSIRAVLADERRERSQRLWDEIEVGRLYDGVVKSMTSYGVFVDIGGVDGMIHISELSWTRIKQPSEVMSVGDEVSVYVLSFDKENRKISLGYKKSEDNPWTKFTTQYSVGDIVNVKIVKMMPFGAFAEICPGVDGLIHISQITDHRIGLPSELLSDGQLVDVKITEIDYERQKVSLSIRALLASGMYPFSSRDTNETVDMDRTPVVIYDTDSPPDLDDAEGFEEEAQDLSEAMPEGISDEALEGASAAIANGISQDEPQNETQNEYEDATSFDEPEESAFPETADQESEAFPESEAQDSGSYEDSQ